MPHLSPLNWIITPLLFWLVLMLFMSIQYFINKPKFHQNISNPLNSTSTKNSWNW